MYAAASTLASTNPQAHVLHAAVDDSIVCRDSSRFDLERLQNGFWIGEVDGDSVFLEQHSRGVFAYIQDDVCVEQWAESFRQFVAAAP